MNLHPAEPVQFKKNIFNDGPAFNAKQMERRLM